MLSSSAAVVKWKLDKYFVILNLKKKVCKKYIKMSRIPNLKINK